MAERRDGRTARWQNGEMLILDPKFKLWVGYTKKRLSVLIYENDLSSICFRLIKTQLC